MKGETIIRPWRMGTRSGSRLVACSAMMSTGLLRPAGGAQAAWSERGTARRAVLPLPAGLLGAHVVHPFLERAVDLGARPYFLGARQHLVVDVLAAPGVSLGTVVAVFLGSVAALLLAA